MKTPEWKMYTIAVRELWACNTRGVPAHWPADPKDWSIAQVLAERDLMRAVAGDAECAERVINRAEGRVPQAPEDAVLDTLNKQADRVAGLSLMAKIQELVTGKPVEMLTEGDDEDDDEA